MPDIQQEMNDAIRGPDGSWLKRFIRENGWFLVLLLMCAMIILTAFIKTAHAASLWRPHVAVFVTTSTRPLHMMMTKMPHIFRTKKACNDFVKQNPKRVYHSIVDMFPTELIIHHEASCLMDESGDEA